MLWRFPVPSGVAAFYSPTSTSFDEDLSSVTCLEKALWKRTNTYQSTLDSDYPKFGTLHPVLGRDTLVMAATMSATPRLEMPKCRNADVEEKSIKQLREHLSRGDFSSRELTECYLKRIELVNPLIKAVIETNPDALLIADRLDEEQKCGNVRSGIHGIPFMVKDNIATKDKMETAAGSAALIGTTVPEDARVVAQLRAAGGVLLGKANLSEWASMRASYYAEAYSSRGGQNRNPYNLAQHPGGSSSGSASSLAANMCAFSIGTETDGSLMFPADRNAVVAIKPTVGLTATQGVVPEAPSFDTVGPFARSVEDAAIVLDIMAEDVSISESRAGDLHTFRPETGLSQPYSTCLADQNILKGAKFGLPWKRVWEKASERTTHSAAYESLTKLITKIEEAGAEVVRVNFPSADEVISPDGWDWEYAAGESGSSLSEFEVVKVEFYRNLRQYLSTLVSNKDMTSLEDVMSYNIKHTAEEGGVPGTHPAWPTGQDNFDRCLASKGEDESVYRKALDYIRRESRERGIDAAIKAGEDTLDGLLVPLQADSGAACSLAAKAGYPMITIPVGASDNGVPFGIGMIQTAWEEHLLVKYGSAIEHLVNDRQRPTFLNINADNYMYVGHPPTET